MRTSPASPRALLLLMLPVLAGVLTVLDGRLHADDGATPVAAVPAYRQANRVAVLTVSGVIDQVTLHSLERRLGRARAAGFDAIVIQLDTPGGAGPATLDICHLIKNDFPDNTVAWVDPMAFSAGTFMALACREIVMSPFATMGDAAPINLFGPIPPTERAKVEAPYLSEVVDSARRHHYDERLCRSFVTISPGLWLLENVSTGDRVVVDPQEFETVMGEPPPSAAPAPPPGWSNNDDFRPYLDKLIKPETRRGDDPVDAETIAKEIELAQALPPARPLLTEEQRGDWMVVTEILPAGRLLTLTTEEARFYGFSKATIADDRELAAYFGAVEVVRMDASWSEALVRFLISLPVRIVLIAIFIIALFLELAAPGVGVFGATAAIALMVLIGAPMLAGLAQWWEVLLILAGLALIAAELFVIPGFGIAGVAGAICLLVGMVGTFVSGDLTSPGGRQDLWTGLAATLGAFLTAAVAIWLISRQIQTLPLFRRFVLNTEIGSSAEVSAAASGVGILAAMGAEQRALEPGDQGVAASDLRPSGRGEFHGRVIDVQSATGYVDEGTPIRVVSVDRFAIEVEVIR